MELEEELHGCGCGIASIPLPPPPSANKGIQYTVKKVKDFPVPSRWTSLTFFYSVMPTYLSALSVFLLSVWQVEASPILANGGRGGYDRRPITAKEWFSLFMLVN